MSIATPATDNVMSLLADLGFDTSTDSGSEIVIDKFDQWPNANSTRMMYASLSGITLNETAKAA
jgi:hypothetical protein